MAIMIVGQLDFTAQVGCLGLKVVTLQSSDKLVNSVTVTSHNDVAVNSTNTRPLVASIHEPEKLL